jgi:hypothetical protein
MVPNKGHVVGLSSPFVKIPDETSTTIPETKNIKSVGYLMLHPVKLQRRRMVGQQKIKS